MKKNILFLFFSAFSSIYAFSKATITKEMLVGNWEGTGTIFKANHSSPQHYIRDFQQGNLMLSIKEFKTDIYEAKITTFIYNDKIQKYWYFNYLFYLAIYENEVILIPDREKPIDVDSSVFNPRSLFSNIRIKIVELSRTPLKTVVKNNKYCMELGLGSMSIDNTYFGDFDLIKTLDNSDVYTKTYDCSEESLKKNKKSYNKMSEEVKAKWRENIILSCFTKSSLGTEKSVLVSDYGYVLVKLPGTVPFAVYVDKEHEKNIKEDNFEFFVDKFLFDINKKYMIVSKARLVLKNANGADIIYTFPQDNATIDMYSRTYGSEKEFTAYRYDVLYKVLFPENKENSDANAIVKTAQADKKGDAKTIETINSGIIDVKDITLPTDKAFKWYMWDDAPQKIKDACKKITFLQPRTGTLYNEILEAIEGEHSIDVAAVDLNNDGIYGIAIYGGSGFGAWGGTYIEVYENGGLLTISNEDKGYNFVPGYNCIISSSDDFDVKLSPNKSNGTSQADIAKHFTYDKSKASKVTSEKKLPATVEKPVVKTKIQQQQNPPTKQFLYRRWKLSDIQQRADEFITDDLRAGIGKTEVQFTREKKCYMYSNEVLQAVLNFELAPDGKSLLILYPQGSEDLPIKITSIKQNELIITGILRNEDGRVLDSYVIFR
jgi:hypothetical protein